MFLNVDLSVQILIRGAYDSCTVPILCKLFKCDKKRNLDLRKKTYQVISMSITESTSFFLLVP